jgi:hypothetical protein
MDSTGSNENTACYFKPLATMPYTEESLLRRIASIVYIYKKQSTLLVFQFKKDKHFSWPAISFTIVLISDISVALARTDSPTFLQKSAVLQGAGPLVPSAKLS